MKLFGYYNEQGYEIVNVDTSETLYSAGNSPLDSQQTVGLDDALPLEIIKDFCERTLNDMETELQAESSSLDYRE